MPLLFGTMRNLPDDGDTDWGGEIRTLLEDVIDALNKTITVSSAVPYLTLARPDLVVIQETDPATNHILAVTGNRIDVIGKNLGGTPSPVTLGASGVNAIADGSADGQTLLVVGTDDAGTVTIDTDPEDAGNVSLNGDVVLGDNDAIFLMWDIATTSWLEISRSN